MLMLLHKDIATKNTKKEEEREEGRKKWKKRGREGGKGAENESPASVNVFRTPVTEKSRKKCYFNFSIPEHLGI